MEGIIYIKNGMKLPTQTQECKKITNDYLATSDDIYDWFRENYERDNSHINSTARYFDINMFPSHIDYIKCTEDREKLK